ncbi:ABC transporter permease [Heliorestis convoluta]|uniref:ABC-2 transporter permease, putative n=1 Tax=Heliorestis convoluta TaxID=356322 RepID=A0A5Q2N629_9FIRM|nr:ABC transporter permease [Heliorestis convoluta]QGG48025.1 ABC-2 transporter permease, putative [Heliorestis convoluta]
MLSLRQSLALVQNENMKIYARPTTWLMIGLLLLLIPVTALLLPLATGITQDFWSFLFSSAQIGAMVTLPAIVIAGNLVAGEFANGTIKLLLIRPVSRGKILGAKYIALLLFIILVVALLFIASMVTALIFFEVPLVTNLVEATMIQENLNRLIDLYLYSTVETVMMATLAFMLSTLFRSNSLAIGLSYLLLFTGPGLMMLLQNFEWSKYLLFANTNLRLIAEGIAPVEGMTVSFALTILLLYFILFQALAWYSFVKRDV